MVAASIGFAVGFLLGLRFKVLVLIPTILLAGTLIGASGGISWSNAGHMLLISAIIQIGYVSGLIARDVVAQRAPFRARTHLDWRIVLRRRN